MIRLDSDFPLRLTAWTESRYARPVVRLLTVNWRTSGLSLINTGARSDKDPSSMLRMYPVIARSDSAGALHETAI